MTLRTVSAIVVSYYTGPRLKECLYALAGDPDITEIVIVDNGNPPEMAAWITAFSDARPHVNLIEGHGNIGFGAAVNRGAAIASGQDLLAVNPDAVVKRGAVRALQVAAERRPTPWIIGGKIFDIGGRETRGARRRELTLWRAISSFIGINTWTLEHTPPPRGPVEMPVISGAFFLISKDSLQQLDGFDEGYFLHVEDVDLCRRCREAGGVVIYHPGAGALHYGSTSEAPTKTVANHKADSLARYFTKFADGPIERIIVAAVVPVLRLAMALNRN